ncbi:MAG: AbrB/MazE/SpoVT family DNA-binding domain-containing protein [Gammaproteobacteria bacterium]|nr:AbrB/MazE/SpoVT family DNA-binding domain-containing protein [Gammaproteobacteria bacterium]
MKQRITKVFKSGNSQAVKLPCDFQVECAEVLIRKQGANIIISPLPTSWKGFMEDISPLSNDFSVEGAELPNDLPRAALQE